MAQIPAETAGHTDAEPSRLRDQRDQRNRRREPSSADVFIASARAGQGYAPRSLPAFLRPFVSPVALVGLELLAFVFDVLVIPRLAASWIYSLPVLVGAYFLPPRPVALLGLLAVVCHSAAWYLTGTSAAVWLSSSSGFVLVVIIAVLLSRNRTALRARAHALTIELGQRTALEAALRHHRRRAEEAVAARDVFLSAATHELRSPLAALRGYAQLARRYVSRGETTNGRLDAALEKIVQQTDKVVALIGQLLDVSRIESGKVELNRRPVDLAALTRSAAAQMQEQGARIVVRGPDCLVVECDPLHVERVLTNVFGNAAKYGPEDGTIEVDLECRDTPGAANRATAWLAVRDHGPGIPEDRRPRLFERFYQAHGEGNHGGLGLGLYLSRQIVELHGGRIWAEFPDDGGARFVVELPVLTAARDATEQRVPHT